MKCLIKSLPLLVIQLLFCSVLFCKDSIAVSTTKDTTFYKEIESPEQILIKYKTILDNDAVAHREYIQNLYSTATYVLGALGLAVLAYFINLFFGNKRIVKDLYVTYTNKEVDKLAQNIEKEYKLKLRRFTSFTNKLLIDVASKSVLTLEDKPLEYVNYDNLNEKRVLWVDDKPFNNKEPREMFEDFGVEFILANTTKEAIDLLNSSKEKFHLIISNLGRQNEKGKEEPTEGITFLKAIKDKRIPKIIYTKPDNVDKYGKEVKEQGSSIAQGYSQLFKEILKKIATKST